MALLQSPAFTFDVKSGEGLTVSMGGVPVIRGSGFQYYSPGWTKGYFSSNYGAQKIERVDADTVRITFSEAQAQGTQTFHRVGPKLVVDSEFNWSGDELANVEYNAGYIWAPAVENGSLNADRKATRALNTYSYGSGGMEERRFSPDARSYSFAGPVGVVDLSASQPLILFDGRGYNQDWADGRQVFWTGILALPVAKGTPSKVHVEWLFGSAPNPPATVRYETLPLKAIQDAVTPPVGRPVLIPKLKEDNLDWDNVLVLGGRYSFPAGRFSAFDKFDAALGRRFVLPTPAGNPVAIDGGVSKLGMNPGGYRITITPTSVSLYGEEDSGVRYGVERLASMAFVKNGKLVLPTGNLTENPVSTWRGTHLFVGQQARPFQKKLWERVLLPLGFNKVVLECERTDWKALPGIKTSVTMSREELAALFAMYRSLNVDPIPLIQSFGHMEWFFANGQNLDVALDPKKPYAVDPRNPRTKEIIGNLWDEVITLLRPATVHFGLDEVDGEGSSITPSDFTDLWRTQLGTLGEIAKRDSVDMMLWGDKCLAPGEAADAMNGDTKAEAAKRRAAIPKGAYIADWHYKADPKPQTFLSSLQLWKLEGFRPIAASWYRPENVRGFTLAANLERVGSLQTTWMGEESSEQNLVENMHQFGAMVMAADYGWSDRQEPVGGLGYNPDEILRQMYFGRPSPVVPVSGWVAGSGESYRVGGVRVDAFTPMALRAATQLAKEAPTTLVVKMQAKGKEIALAMDTLTRCEDGAPVADLTIELANGKTISKSLLYGRHVRSADDNAVCAFADRDRGVSVLRITLGSVATPIKSVKLASTSTYAGLRLRGITIF